MLESPLSLAEVARCLLDNGAAVNDGGGAHCGGMTPLMDAATNGHLDVVELVVGRGTELRARDTQVGGRETERKFSWLSWQRVCY